MTATADRLKTAHDQHLATRPLDSQARADRNGMALAAIVGTLRSVLGHGEGPVPREDIARAVERAFVFAAQECTPQPVHVTGPMAGLLVGGELVNGEY